MTERLGVIETGNDTYIKFVITAQVVTPTAASTAVTFTRHNPDGTEETASSPTAAITGPTAGTVIVDGVTLTTTTWHWRTPTFIQAGTATIRARSTAGIFCSDNATVVTPSYAPFATA